MTLPPAFASSPGVRRRMQAIRSTNTKPELALRSELWRLGYRYRLHARPIADLNRRADLVFRRQRVAVFLDGCFWHGCPEHGRRRHVVNEWYWPDKIEGNRRRDADTNRRLSQAGWSVVRIWEHEPMPVAVATVSEALDRGIGEQG